ncbi:hypothetical protein NDU88_003068 [Pleurodeles waltl]|uniref:Uncharacterized protein n=1 Tax=Pleurodeles waltl TaxID=8319 RepID=A0AAV7NNP1_PLEWA|nr:hypothetical protein NDU88_003068 [Pleurodeles waltl]
MGRGRRSHLTHPKPAASPVVLLVPNVRPSVWATNAQPSQQGAHGVPGRAPRSRPAQASPSRCDPGPRRPTSMPLLVTPSLKAVHRTTAHGARCSPAPGPGPPAHASIRRPGDLSVRAPQQLSFTGGAATARSQSRSDPAGRPHRQQHIASQLAIQAEVPTPGVVSSAARESVSASPGQR